MTLLLIILFTFFSNLLSIIGVLFLVVKKIWSESLSASLVSFAAGLMIATAFLDLLPEAAELLEEQSLVFVFALIGFVFFYFTERYLLLFDHHHHHMKLQVVKPSSNLIFIGDMLHNFIDGVLIAGSFIVNPSLGISTSIAVFLHEIPKEISDFSIYLYGGVTQRKAILYNLAAGAVAVLGALIGYFYLSIVSGVVPYLLALGAGMFIYIAATELIPETQKLSTPKTAARLSAFFLLGIFVVWVGRLLEIP